MIPSRDVTTAVLASLRGVWPAVGDGGPPVNPPADRPCAWLTPEPSPGNGPHAGGGEPDATIRVRVTVSAVDGDHARSRHARTQAQGLADDLRGHMLTTPLWSGDTWRVSGRRHEATAVVGEPGGVTVHQDFLLYVASTALHP